MMKPLWCPGCLIGLCLAALATGCTQDAPASKTLAAKAENAGVAPVKNSEPAHAPKAKSPPIEQAAPAQPDQAAPARPAQAQKPEAIEPAKAPGSPAKDRPDGEQPSSAEQKSDAPVITGSTLTLVPRTLSKHQHLALEKEELQVFNRSYRAKKFCPSEIVVEPDSVELFTIRNRPRYRVALCTGSLDGVPNKVTVFTQNNKRKSKTLRPAFHTYRISNTKLIDTVEKLIKKL